MSYSNRPNAGTNWTAMAEGVLQLVQLATAVASARLMEMPAARSLQNRARVVSYSAKPKRAARAQAQFDEAMSLIGQEYQGLTQCLIDLNLTLRFTAAEARSFSLHQAVDADAPFDCEPFDRIRCQAEAHLHQVSRLHAQIVCSVMTIVDNVHHAYICPPCPPKICVGQNDPNAQQDPNDPHGPLDPEGTPIEVEDLPGNIGDPVEENPFTGGRNTGSSRRNRRGA